MKKKFEKFSNFFNLKFVAIKTLHIFVTQYIKI